MTVSVRKRNPLAARLNLISYVFFSSRSRMLQIAGEERIVGARSFKEMSFGCKMRVVLKNLLILLGLFLMGVILMGFILAVDSSDVLYAIPISALGAILTFTFCVLEVRWIMEDPTTRILMFLFAGMPG